MVNTENAVELELIRARAKFLAREDRLMRAELVRLREQAGLTQAEVGELLGVSQQAVNKFERYDSDPKLSTLRRYANAIGAVIEHRVAPDVGQTVLAAAASPWESIATVSSDKASTTRFAPKISSGWFEAKRADFDLAV